MSRFPMHRTSSSNCSDVIKIKRNFKGSLSRKAGCSEGGLTRHFYDVCEVTTVFEEVHARVYEHQRGSRLLKQLINLG